MALNGIIEVKPIEFWGIDFIIPFASSYSNQDIIVYVDYVTTWVESITYVTNDSHILNNFFENNVFARLGVYKGISPKMKHGTKNGSVGLHSELQAQMLKTHFIIL